MRPALVQHWSRDYETVPGVFRKRRDRNRVPSHMTVRAMWNGAVLAESDDTIVVEGNHYFPPEAICREYFEESAETSVSPWKGTARYYDVVVNGDRNAGAAWYYPHAKAAAAKMKVRVAFWRGVKVEET